MAVKVQSARSRETFTHEKGTSIGVEEGHLRVAIRSSGGGTKTLAVYAPGIWASAAVTDDTTDEA